MRTDGCRRLRGLLTSYVDDEVDAGQRRLIDDHLERCEGCRRRLDRERMVRHRLQRWSAEARTEGAPVSSGPVWWSRPSRITGPLIGFTAVVALLVVVGLIWSLARPDAGELLAARGEVTDSVCAGGHAHESPEMKKMSGRDCVLRCIGLGARYVFVSQDVVYQIRNQDLEDLDRLAGQEVVLEGRVRDKVLTVSRISPLSANHANHTRRSRHGRVS